MCYSWGNTHFFLIIKSVIQASRSRLSLSDGKTILQLMKPETQTTSMMSSAFLDRSTASSLQNILVSKSKFFRAIICSLDLLSAHSFEGTELKDTQIKANSSSQANVLA